MARCSASLRRASAVFGRRTLSVVFPGWSPLRYPFREIWSVSERVKDRRMERETGIEPARSSLGSWQRKHKALRTYDLYEMKSL